MSLIDPLTGIPTYINEEIDILSDSTMEICEKLAYRAHGGTYVEGLWDASPSTLISIVDDDVEWKPLEVRLHGGDLKNSFDSEVSDVEEYCLASGNNPFFGYTSEPPIAPAFREAKPASLATPALQSLGRLHALLKLDGREDEIEALDEFFCAMWGINPQDLAYIENLEPEINARSKIDLIKGVRSKTHRIYGYENEQNYVTISGGGYTQASMNDSRYIDWHRINLVMRFVGLNLLVSDELGRNRLKNQNHVIKYGLVAREFPLVVNAPHLPSFKGIYIEPPDIEITNAFKYAIAFYSSERVVAALADRNRLASEKIQLSEHFVISDVTLATVKQALNKPKKVRMLDTTFEKPSKYDIVDPTNVSINKPLEGKLSKLHVHHNMSMMRAAELVLLSKMILLWKQPQGKSIRDTMDSLSRDVSLDEKQRYHITKTIADMFGRHAGGIIWRVLKKFHVNDASADVEYMTFCVEMHEKELLTDIPSRSEFFWRSSHSSSAYKKMTEVFKRTYSKLIHFYNVPRLPDYFATVAISKEEEFLVILNNLWQKKKAYWLGHYTQRKAQMTELVSQTRKPDKVTKGKLIRYQWLVKWIPIYQAEVSSSLEVWPIVPNKLANSLLKNTVDSFTRKRVNKIDQARKDEHFKNFARRIDTELKPPFSFYQLYENVHNTVKEMSRDIAKVFKTLTEPNDAFSSDDPLAFMWQKSLADAMTVQTDWEEYLEQSGSEADWEKILDLDDPHFASSLSAETILEKLQSANILSSNQVTLPTTSANNAAIDLEKEPQIAQAPVDLTEAMPSKPLKKLDLSALRKKKTNLSFAGFAGPSQPVLTFKSPIAEMQDRIGETPNLLQWANAASVEVSKLEKCTKAEFQTIYDIGKSLLGGNKVTEQVESYDVL